MTAPSRPAVAVVGCGLMGSGIAEVMARAGRTVVVARGRRRRRRARAARASRPRSAGRCAAASSTRPCATRSLGRIEVGTDLEALADAELVVEAASEDEAVKTELFRRLDAVVVRDDAVLASNTSSIPIMKLGTATSGPSRSSACTSSTPCRCSPLVEVVPSLLTSDETVQRGAALRRGRLGKTRHPLAGPRRLHRQRAAGAVPAVGDADARVGLRLRPGHRRRHGEGLRPPDGPAAARPT